MDQLTDEYRRKKYGQFFSGNSVAKMLVNMIPEEINIENVIDPMVGSGDMLKAVSDRYLNIKKFVGVDIDPIAVKMCKKNMPNAHIYTGSAFANKKIIRKKGWDLVITNPPYVRYQLQNSKDEFGLPTSDTVRKNLKDTVLSASGISPNEKDLYLTLINNYSGLSDLAVPSWILCALLVKKNGFLAMVVPETWLNRDYALPIHYLLLKCFNVVAIVKDVESKWFTDASIRTCLIVAKKRQQMTSLISHHAETYCIELSGSMIGPSSLVEKLIYRNQSAEKAICEILRLKETINLDGCNGRNIQTTHLFINLMRNLTSLCWISDEDRIENKNIYLLPEELSKLFDDKEKYESLEDMGWSVGQGLRTGANDFFYGEIEENNNPKNKVRVHTRKWYGEVLITSKSNIRVAIQNRNEVTGLNIQNKMLKKCIFYIQESVRENDYTKIAPIVKEKYEILDQDIKKYITRAEQYINPKSGKKFKMLSAVKPNEKKSTEGYLKFWYMLPQLQKRHEPDLCIPRLCGKSVECLHVQNEENNPIVVDANFITLWNSEVETHMYTFALLNSTWFKCYMEYIGTRMGGGALKIEASHLRQVLFPQMDYKKKKKLSELGEELCAENVNIDTTISRIDSVMFSDDVMEKNDKVIKALKNMLDKKLRERGVI